MEDIIQHWPQVTSAYLVAVLSPGPATMAIASDSLGQDDGMASSWQAASSAAGLKLLTLR
ncbi:hypothetical protein [Rhizobium sp. AAP43]|uniref:hypothetical protein n=1 Tax=Rhizobium sp. AAP43 TaxID=1523420 RepID=UPI0006B8AD9D|nr:hypothetical protein [Rhizobium sp. AAP43]KPF45049.1 hypothetical protein IP76_09380 [Rhizobium sp. AAP43]